jgi:hypothetical protein
MEWHFQQEQRMRCEITIHIRFAGASTEDNLEELANSFYIRLDDIRHLQERQDYTTAFTEALNQSVSGLSVGNVSVREM